MRVSSRHPWFAGPAARRVAAAAVLVATGALTVTFVSSGGKGTASAETNLSQYVPIEQVAVAAPAPEPGPGAATGTFAVDCGTNGNGKFSPDNPVAQPGIKNGAEHVHDFVGNQAITADTSDEALAAAGTTCRNGDRSSYFWPVLRIDKSVRADSGGSPAVPALSCPNVRDRLPAMPASGKAEVDRRMAALDRATAAAAEKIAAHRSSIDPRFNESVIGPLRERRAAALRDIQRAVGGSGLLSMADCQVSYDGAHAAHTAAGTVANAAVRCPSVRDRLPAVPDDAVAGVNRALAKLDRQVAAANEQLVRAPSDRDKVLTSLRAQRSPVISRIAAATGASLKGQGLSRCTLSTDALAAPAQPAPAQPAPAQPAQPSPSAPAALPDPSGPNLELPGNTGGIVRPAAVLVEYRGNATGKVQPMPKFLRALTGDAKPTSRGPANARATWSCSGFTDRLSDRYPICPQGSQVMRIQDFPGCWDGTNIDSANHRSHLAFADPATGACPANFVAIPQLRISISYDIPRDVQLKGQFALDSFPEENHNPFSDHNDFVNVNSNRQMAKIAKCVNSGRRCA